MAQQWDGILLRDDLSEQGLIPRNALATSPDIVLSGWTPLPDPGALTTPDSYGRDFDQGLRIGMPNYIYVRGKNGTDGSLSGNWNLFFATPNILLFPSLWERNVIATSAGNRNPRFAIGAGEIGVCADPFTWVPSDVSDNYCLIATASTPGHGNPLQRVVGITDLAEVLSLNANIAQRNVQIFRGTPPQIVFSAGYYQGAETAMVDLTLLFENIPRGSSYTFASAVPLNGQMISHSESNTTQTSFRYGWTDLAIPAQWNTRFTGTLAFGGDWSGIPPGQKPRVTIRVDLVQQSVQRLYGLGSEPGPAPVTGAPRLGGATGPIRVVTAGSYAVTCPDMGP